MCIFSLAEHDRSKLEGSEVDHQVKRIIIHPLWRERILDNDVALLEVTRPIKFNRNVSPACLPVADAVV